jgi:hypothetical protein
VVIVDISRKRQNLGIYTDNLGKKALRVPASPCLPSVNTVKSKNHTLEREPEAGEGKKFLLSGFDIKTAPKVEARLIFTC